MYCTKNLSSIPLHWLKRGFCLVCFVVVVYSCIEFFNCLTTHPPSYEVMQCFFARAQGKSVGDIQSILERYPRDLCARITLVALLLDRYQFQDAHKEIDKVISSGRMLDQAYMIKSYIYVSSWENIDRKRVQEDNTALEQAQRCLEKTFKFNPRHVDANILHAKLVGYMQDVQEALKILAEAKSEHSENLWVYLACGSQFPKQKNETWSHGFIIQNSRYALKLDSNSWRAYNNLAWGYYAEARYFKAMIKEARNSTQILPAILDDLERKVFDANSNAVYACTKAIELNPFDCSAYRCRGLVCYDRNEFEKADADFTKSLEIRPGANVYFARAKTRFYLNRFEDAKKDAETSLLEIIDPEEKSLAQELLMEIFEKSRRNST